MDRGNICHLFIQSTLDGSGAYARGAAVLTDPHGKTAARCAGCFTGTPRRDHRRKAALAMLDAGLLMASDANVSLLMVHADETDGHDMFGLESGGLPDGCIETGIRTVIPDGGPDPEGDNFWWEGAIDKAYRLAETVQPPIAAGDAQAGKPAAIIASDYDDGRDLAHAAVLLASGQGAARAFLCLSGTIQRPGPGNARRIAVDAAMLLAREYGSENLDIVTTLSDAAHAKKRTKNARPDGLAAKARLAESEWEDAAQEAMLDAIDSIFDDCAESGL